MVSIVIGSLAACTTDRPKQVPESHNATATSSPNSRLPSAFASVAPSRGPPRLTGSTTAAPRLCPHKFAPSTRLGGYPKQSTRAYPNGSNRGIRAHGNFNYRVSRFAVNQRAVVLGGHFTAVRRAPVEASHLPLNFDTFHDVVPESDLRPRRSDGQTKGLTMTVGKAISLGRVAPLAFAHGWNPPHPISPKPRAFSVQS